MRIRRAPAALSALSALALVLSGCGGSEEEETPSATEQEGPLAEYMSAVYGGDLSPEEQQQQYEEEQAKTEELVSACMQEQGFEYRPMVSSGSFTSGDDGQYRPDDRDWVAEYGYGAVKSPYTEEPPTEEDQDPNADYVASLSESEQTAFYEALYGPSPTEEELAEDGSYEYDWTTAGCQGSSQHEVSGDDPASSEEFKPLFDAINELYTDMSSWPGMAELDGAWAACMETAGHGGFTAQSDAANSVYEDMNAVYEAGVSADGEVTEEPDQAAIDEIGEREVELALADLDCREETDYTASSAEISRDVEQEFVDDHKTELDALKTAAEQDGP